MRRRATAPDLSPSDAWNKHVGLVVYNLGQEADIAAAPRKDAIMARAGTKILDSGEVLPSLSMDTVAHGRLTVPEHFNEGWGVLLLYRAHW